MARYDTPLTLTPANTRRFPDGGNRNRPEPLRLDALARFHQLRLHGLARAKAESQEQRRRRGKKAIGRPQVSAKTEEAIRDHLRDGIGIVRIAKLFGAGVGTVHRIKKSMESVRRSGAREFGCGDD